MSKDDELREELEFHLDEEAEEHRERGLSAGEARAAARRGFGNVALVQEDTRAVWTWTLLEHFAQDVRYALRTMAANKTFSALAVLSLALGIGANTAIFSFMDSILLRSLPVADPASLVTLMWHTQQNEVHGMNRHDDSSYDAKAGLTAGFFSYSAFELFHRNTSVFSSVFGYQGAGDLILSTGGQAEVAKTEYVSGDYFPGLMVPPAAGRLIEPDDDRAGAPRVAVVSFGLSQKRSVAAGQQVLINNLPFTVIGVAPPEFFGVDPAVAPDVYVPLRTMGLWEVRDRTWATERRFIDPDFDWVDLMARLRPGVSMAQAQAAVAPQFAEFERTITQERTRTDLATLLLRDGSGGLDDLRREYSKPLYILLTLVGLILAIACANIANLLLARAASRRREIAVRLSMGAGRMRVIRQLLTESVLLAAMGGALGVGFAVWGIRSLSLLQGLHADLNWHVLAVAAALSLLTGVLFGLAPALQATRVDLAPALKQSRTGDRRTRTGLSRTLVVSQIAFTLLILVAAGLFTRTLTNLESIQLGFNRENVLTFAINASAAGHRDPEIGTFYEDLRTRFAALPGVKGASLSNLPLLGVGRQMTMIAGPGGKSKGSLILSVGPGFLSTMQIPILLGREFDNRDRRGGAMTAVVNRTFAKQWFGEQNPVGQHITVSDRRKFDVEIVGLCGDARYGHLKEEVSPTVFFPFAQWPVEEMVYELRTAGDPLGYVQSVRGIVHQADARIPVGDVHTQGALIDALIGREITFARLCSVFALLALAIAGVGLYGTMSYNVARRTGEIGIRVALGAQRNRVVWMVLREVMGMLAMGLAIGLSAALAAAKLIKTFLFGVEPSDAAALAPAVVTLAFAAVLAGYLPARSAARVDPMKALRHE